MKIVAVVCCLISLLLNTFALAADAENQKEAFLIVGTQFEIVEQLRLYCGKTLPALKKDIDRSAWHWRKRNSEEKHALIAFMQKDDNIRDLVSVRDEVVQGHLTLFSSPSGKAVGEKCSRFFEDLDSKTQTFAAKSPQASRLLRNYLRRRPLPAPLAAEHRFIDTCLQRRQNKNFDLDEALAYCECAFHMQQVAPSAPERANVKRSAKGKKAVQKENKTDASLELCTIKN